MLLDMSAKWLHLAGLTAAEIALMATDNAANSKQA